MSRIKEATTEQWKEFGAASKRIRDELSNLIVAISPFVSVNSKTIRNLQKSIHYFDEFRSEAEEEMYKQKIQPNEDPLNVFYGPRQQ